MYLLCALGAFDTLKRRQSGRSSRINGSMTTGSGGLPLLTAHTFPGGSTEWVGIRRPVLQGDTVMFRCCSVLISVGGLCLSWSAKSQRTKSPEGKGVIISTTSRLTAVAFGTYHTPCRRPQLSYRLASISCVFFVIHGL